MTEYSDNAERERLSRRIALIAGTEQARALRRFREQINKLPEILKRGVRAFPQQTRKGMRYRAADELRLCHQFLDKVGVDRMHA